MNTWRDPVIEVFQQRLCAGALPQGQTWWLKVLMPNRVIPRVIQQGTEFENQGSNSSADWVVVRGAGFNDEPSLKSCPVYDRGDEQVR